MNASVPAATDATPSVEPTLSPLARSVAMFTRPAQAWVGLRERAQWWFPMVLMVAFAALSSALLFDRALMPMLTEGWERQVANGQMPPEQLEHIQQFFAGPAGRAFLIGQQAVGFPLITLVIALLIWFGVGFVLGTGMKYRLALEVACWSSLIALPAQLLTAGLSWTKETFRGVHVGFGLLLPDVDPPTKLHTAAGVLLDAIGPLSIWYVVVAVLGAAALSGAPRRSVVWTMGVLYLVVMVFVAGLAALGTPSG